MVRHLTLMILKRDGKILLGVKKRGFGMGRINGIGGKVEKGETIREAAIRETFEEVGIRVNDCSDRGQIVFRNLYFAGKPETDIMHVFISENFSGEAIETDEIAPRWYPINDIPSAKMWSDDEHWLPEVLRGNRVDAFFLFNKKNTFTDYRVNIAPSAQLAAIHDRDFGLPDNEDETKFSVRTAARAVLLDNKHRVALIDATTRGYYKLPGGGIDDGELIEEALHREVIEEAGYRIKDIIPLGYTHETRHKYKQFNISYAFIAHADKFVGNNLMEDEKEDGFELKWFDNIDDAIKAVESVDTSDKVYQAKFFTVREAAILRAGKKVLKERYGQ